MDKNTIDFYTRLAHGLAAQFGSNCEIVVHDLESNDVEHSIVAIENGYISGRKLGDGPSHIVLESLQNGEKHTEDKLAYLTKTKDGKILKSSTIYIRNPKGKDLTDRLTFQWIDNGSQYFSPVYFLPWFHMSAVQTRKIIFYIGQIVFPQDTRNIAAVAGIAQDPHAGQETQNRSHRHAGCFFVDH